jgi:ectoine hydroxylase-related dioxygenase (phytanoyl-CoA dioxygenase family)
MVTTSPGSAPLDERVEFLSDGWIAQAHARLRSSIQIYRHELGGAELSLCEAFSDAPPHLARPGNVAAWNVRIRGGDIAVRPGVDESCAVQIRGDYQTILPVAQAVGPTALKRAQRETAHRDGKDFAKVTGTMPSGRLGDILADLHDHMARRTLENPDLQHRIARQGLAAPVKQIEEDGYCVLENAISPHFCDELREACLAEAMDHRPELRRSGRFDTNGLIARGRCFEEIAQLPKLRTLIESSLGPGFIAHTIGACVVEAGPAALGMHADYVAVPDPYPEYALVGVAVWAFDDWTTAEAGPTWIIPGSHRRRRAPRPTDSMEGGIPILMPKGSVTFFTHGVWHWQGARTLPGLRVTMHNAYGRPFIRPADDYGAIDPAILHRNSPVLSTICGLDDYFGRTGHVGHDYNRMTYMYRALAQAKPLAAQ